MCPPWLLNDEVEFVPPPHAERVSPPGAPTERSFE
jgi:hypothetical protein